MKIVLTEQESEKYFETALCDGLGYFLTSYGFCIDLDGDKYAKVKNMVRAEVKEDEGDDEDYSLKLCREPLLMMYLKEGGSIKFQDDEGDYDTDLTIKLIHERVQETPIEHLVDMVNEQGDADTADAVIQSVLFGEVIFG